MIKMFYLKKDWIERKETRPHDVDQNKLETTLQFKIEPSHNWPNNHIGISIFGFEDR